MDAAMDLGAEVVRQCDGYAFPATEACPRKKSCVLRKENKLAIQT
jgi:hypothetical protein